MKVSIIQRVLPHYRIPLFKLLEKNLKKYDIEFQLVYGQEYPGTVPITVKIDEKWAHSIDNKYLNVFGIRLVWQPCLDIINKSDLLIFEQSNSLLINYWLLLKRGCDKNLKLAYWGHGKNLQAKSLKISEYLKRALICQVDWWFAYTDITSYIIKNTEFNSDNITVLNNSIDTLSMRRSIIDLSDHKINQIRDELGLQNSKVALYCGGMYANKNLDFLIEACIAIRNQLPSFHLLMIGDGPEQYKVIHAAKKYTWLTYLGPKFGQERVAYFKLADIFLMPGLVGLALLDSFASGIPLFTTDIPIHSPEIAYLDHGKNGFMTNPNIHEYVDSVCLYLRSEPEYIIQIENSCLMCAERYTLENMVNCFVEGIHQSLVS
jgi:glycosyltransferase involved in cell wall biosynthesis